MSDPQSTPRDAAAETDSVAETPEAAVESVDPNAGGADPEVSSTEPAPEAGSAAPGAGADPGEEDQAARYLALAQRTQADFENFKKRAARDAALAQQRGVSKLVKDLLPALDNLARAITHAPAEDPLLEGIKLVQSDLHGALTRAGIEAFDPAGESFDPNLHEAVAQFPKEGVAPGTVVEVYQAGYRLGETVLRPARVVVAA